MENLIHADIFFFIASIAVVLITAGLLVVIVYVTIFIRNLTRISNSVKKGTDEIVGGAKTIREVMERVAFEFASYISHWFGSRKRRK